MRGTHMRSPRKISRQRRAIKTALKIRELGVARLTVHRTPQHIYAQVFDAAGAKVLATASTVQEEVAQGPQGHRQRRGGEGRGHARSPSAPRPRASRKVAFDRSGFTYHGRVKALADAAREAGLEF